ncbi:hypothetical protein [Embleya hyalina]|uniref:Uncharacterized protein n=1 Tax=Embleya hyalina TaxID=516124 RepID=A0A401YYS8_9ACTN|nr:hypothetical protein [Embleya hyalina]GCD99743.1 hypothetical protein EHYA_07465 [Embleya hyalina]
MPRSVNRVWTPDRIAAEIDGLQASAAASRRHLDAARRQAADGRTEDIRAQGREAVPHYEANLAEYERLTAGLRRGDSPRTLGYID